MTKSLLIFIVLSINSVYFMWAQDIESDLIAYYTFSQGVEDVTQNSTPILSGMETFTEDRAGNSDCALQFSNQPDEFVQIPMNADNALIQGDDATVSFWFKMNNTEVGNLEYLFQKGASGSEGFQMAVYDMNTPVISDSTNGLGIWDNDWNGNPDLYDDIENWHHYAMVLTSTEVKLYRDNVLRNTYTYSGNGFDIDDIFLDYRIGQFFEGMIDDLRVYRRALTENEIGILFNLPADCLVLGTPSFSDLTAIELVTTPERMLSIYNLPTSKYEIEIYSMLGQQLFSNEFQQTTSAQRSFDLSNFSSSVYLLKVKDKVSGASRSMKFQLR